MEASRAIFAVEVEGLCIIQRGRLTSRSSSGVSRRNLSSPMLASFIHNGRIFQTNHCKADEAPLVAGVEDHPQSPARTILPADAEVTVVVEATFRNFRLPRHYRVSGMKNGRCYGPSNLSGQSRPPHFFKKPRNFLSLLSKIQVSVPFP